MGMFGTSYLGGTQWLAAMSRPPSLMATVPRMIGSDFYDGVFYQGGALQWGLIVSWGIGTLALANLERLSRDIAVPPETVGKLIAAVDGLEEAFRFLPASEFPHLKDGLAPYFYEWLAHPRYDDYWKLLRIEDHYSEMAVPALNIGGWHDAFLSGTLKNYQGMVAKGATDAARRGQKLLIGPWHHGPGTDVSGEFYFGLMANDAAIDLHGLHLRWYDYWLKGIDNGIMDESPVRIFVMGDNVWRYEQEWPLARARYVDYYLHSDGKANTLNGDGGYCHRKARDQSRPTCSSTTPGHPCLRGAAGFAAPRPSWRQAPSTGAQSSPVTMCWSTRRPRWSRTWKLPDLLPLPCTRPARRRIPTSPPRWRM